MKDPSKSMSEGNLQVSHQTPNTAEQTMERAYFQSVRVGTFRTNVDLWTQQL